MQERDNNLSAAVCSMRAAVADRLIASGDADCALLYIYLIRRGSGPESELCRALNMRPERLRAAAERLRALGLVSGGAPLPSGELPEYTAEDVVRRSREDPAFRCILAEAESVLGLTLSTQETKTLSGVYDYVGLPSDVIFLLVGYCCERTAQRYGPGRRPTLRQIEREGYTWARLGLMDQDRAAAYIRDRQRQREALPRLMALLRLGDRPASPSEEKYLLSWAAMGFEDAAIERAYDKTILKCKELKWPYMNKILTSWHEKGLHTLREVEDGDRPAPRRQAPQPQGAQAREDMARMERYLQRLREQSKGKEGA